MLKLSKLTDYAVILLASMEAEASAQSQSGVPAGAQQSASQLALSASGLSAVTNLPEPTVCKILKLLAKSDLVHSTRGVNGGYRLQRALEEISLACVVEAIEGPVVLTSCVDQDARCCERHSVCEMRGKWQGANHVVHMALRNVSLAEMIGRRQ